MSATAEEPARPFEWWVVVVFAAAAMVLYRRAVFLGEQFFYRDLATQWYPQVEAFVYAIRSGSWPVWNPFISFGQPLLASPNAQLLYPLTWLQLLMPAWTFYTWYTVAHVTLAGCGTYALGRHLGLSRTAALAAGLLWVLSGPFLSLLNLWNHFAGAAWLPWAVWAGDRVLGRWSVRASLLCGALMGAMVLVGSPESLLMAIAAISALTLRRVPAWRREPKKALALLRGPLLAGAFAAALSAGQWLPTLDVARGSARADLRKSERELWSVHPLGLSQAVFPVFAQRLPLRPIWRERLLESREPFLESLYLGLSALALVAAGVLAPRGRSWTWPLMALAGAAILVAVGRHLPVYPLLATLLPPIRSLRFPVKAMVLASLCIALVGGWGFDAWRSRPGRTRSWLLAVGMLVPAAVALGVGALLAVDGLTWGPAILLSEPQDEEAFAAAARALLFAGALGVLTAVLALVARRRWRPSLVAGTVLAIALVDLTVAERDLNPTAPRGALSGIPAVLAVAQPAAHQRMFVHDYAFGRANDGLLGRTGYLMAERPGGWEPWQTQLGFFVYAHPALLALWGREGSYGGNFLQILSRDVDTVNALVTTNARSPAMLHRLLRLGAVDPVIAMHRTGFEELTPVATLPSLFANQILVFRVPDTLPRTYVVGRARIAPPGQGWRALLAPDFDPAREIVLPEGPAVERDGPIGTSRIVAMRPDRVTIEADLQQPGYVVLVDAFDSGWKVRLDDRPATLLRANVAFRAVAVPAGRHRVEMVYRPASVIVGLTSSALAALAGLAVWAASLVRARQARQPPAAAEPC